MGRGFCKERASKLRARTACHRPGLVEAKRRSSSYNVVSPGRLYHVLGRGARSVGAARDRDVTEGGS